MGVMGGGLSPADLNPPMQHFYTNELLHSPMQQSTPRKIPPAERMQQMAVAACKSEFIKDLMEVLGIDRTITRSFTLHAAVDDVVTLEVVQYAEGGKDHTVIKKYRLVMEEVQQDGEPTTEMLETVLRHHLLCAQFIRNMEAEREFLFGTGEGVPTGVIYATDREDAAG